MDFSQSELEAKLQELATDNPVIYYYDGIIKMITAFAKNKLNKQREQTKKLQEDVDKKNNSTREMIEKLKQEKEERQRKWDEEDEKTKKEREEESAQQKRFSIQGTISEINNEIVCDCCKETKSPDFKYEIPNKKKKFCSRECQRAWEKENNSSSSSFSKMTKGEVIGGFFVIVVIIFLLERIKLEAKCQQETVAKMLEEKDLKKKPVNLLLYNISWIFSFITVVLIAPIVEECVFRYLIFEIFNKNNPLAYICSGLGFIFLHWGGGVLNFTTIGFLLLSYLPMTIFFIYAYRKKKNNQDHRIIAKELELYILDDQAGQVITPILGSEYLYQTSGHLDHYQASMFPAISRDNETFYLRPMTCPHHCLIYRQKPRSYRELPFRLCENSLLFRYEASGALKGLERARGEAAFYGPKLDIEVQTADGKNITLATIQLDFVLPEKFGLKYIDKEQNLQTPAIIHHAPAMAILPINEEEEVKKYCEELKKELIKDNLRVKIISKKTLGYRINEVYQKKIPYYLVIGKEELKTKRLKLIYTYQEGKTEELTEKELYNKLKKEKNTIYPENRKNYQEGVDYRIEEMGGDFKKYIILSEKLKADFRRFNVNSDIFPDEHFAWGSNMSENLKKPGSSDYKAVQAVQKAGANTRGRFYEEGVDEKEIISGDLIFDEATYSELRKAVFANQLKNILKNKSEWKIEEKLEKTNQKNITLKSKNTEIEREVKERSIVSEESEQADNKSPNHNNLIIFNKNTENSQFLNENIPFSQVLLVTNKEEKEIITRQKALEKAKNLGLDLFCVAPSKNPPICKLINYQKYIFELSKKKKDKKENICKETRITFNIGKNDLKEKAHPDLAHEKCQKIIEELKSQSPKIELKDNIRQHLDTNPSRKREFLEKISIFNDNTINSGEILNICCDKIKCSSIATSSLCPTGTSSTNSVYFACSKLVQAISCEGGNYLCAGIVGDNQITSSTTLGACSSYSLRPSSLNPFTATINSTTSIIASSSFTLTSPTSISNATPISSSTTSVDSSDDYNLTQKIAIPIGTVVGVTVVGGTVYLISRKRKNNNSSTQEQNNSSIEL
ncbi:9721_t:CDS:10, partial [Entrophospora sp. SA101]